MKNVIEKLLKRDPNERIKVSEAANILGLYQNS